MPRAPHTRWIPHRRYHGIPGGNDEQRRGERGRYPWRRSFFRPQFAESDHYIEPGAWFAMIDNKKWKMQEWTQREIRKNIWKMAITKKRPGSAAYKDYEDNIVMLNDILFDLHEANDAEAEEIFADHPLHYHTIAEGPFERLGARSRYPQEAPQWIPSRSRHTQQNTILHETPDKNAAIHGQPRLLQSRRHDVSAKTKKEVVQRLFQSTEKNSNRRRNASSGRVR